MGYFLKNNKDVKAFNHFSMMKNKKSITKKDLLKECDDLVNHFIFREKEEKVLQMSKEIVEGILDNAQLKECVIVKREFSKTVLDDMEDTREILFESDIDNIIELFVKIDSLSLIPGDLYDDMIELLENFRKAFNKRRGKIENDEN